LKRRGQIKSLNMLENGILRGLLRRGGFLEMKRKNSL
jgi:hypothetical protein